MSKRLERYREAKQNRLNGKYNGAPFFHSFPRLGQIIPSLMKGTQVLTIAGSGVGKSNSMIGIGIMTIYNLIKNHSYKAKMFIFLLEDQIELLEDRLFCRIMYTRFRIKIDPMALNSMREKLLSEDIEAKFEEVDEAVEDILSYCEVITNIYNPTGIYKYLRTKAGELGEHVWENRKFTYKNKDGTTYEKDVPVYKEYIPNDPDLHVFVFVDNLNNLSEEYDKGLNKSLTIKESIGKWCRDYGRLQITKHWNWTIWNLQQTAMEADKKQFDLRGNNVVEKLEPNLSSLGESKTVARDHHLIFALFSPHRFGVEEYEGYAINRLGDGFRSLIILKSNFSISNVKVPLYFQGAGSYYCELPKLMTADDYTKYGIK